MSMLATAAAVLTITVRVYDFYGLPADQRHKALALTAETLAQAGVATTWLDCMRDGDVPPPPACLAALQPGEMILRFHHRSQRSDHILGTAIVQDGGPNVLASIYTESVLERSIKTGVPLWIILGRVGAHELGHLLLGVNSHTSYGLMQAKWDLRRLSTKDWQFTSEDAVKMRSGMLVRREGVVAASE